MEDLTKQFNADYQILKDLEEPLAFHYYKSNVPVSKLKPGVNSQFIYNQIFLEYLLQIPSTDFDRTELIEILRKEYQKNSNELSNLKQFEKDYSPSQSLSWCLTDSFFSKTLRGMFSKKNLSIVFLFRSYLIDLWKQLNSSQSKDQIKVYRSAIISREELRTFQEYINQFLSINSLFSARIDREKVRTVFKRFTNSSETIRVLFEIDADPKYVSSKPFAVINHNGESLVLFMIGSIFRVESTICDDDGIWIIQMSLCHDREQSFEEIFRLMKEQFQRSEITLQKFGLVLCKMNELDLAEKCFQRLLNELSSNNSSRLSVYQNLADLASVKEDFQMMAHWHEKLREHRIIPNDQPVAKDSFSTPRTIIKTKWIKDAVTIAGGNGQGNRLNQLFHPHGIAIDDDNQLIYISEWSNHRIVQWKFNASSGEIFVGNFGQLNKPTDLILDRNTDSLIVCDHGNERVVKYSRQNPTNMQTIISDIHCFGLAIDNRGNIYVSNWKTNEVRRWKIGEQEGTLVAGGNGQGNNLNQLNCPTYIFVDNHYSIYISDCDNNRVVKWIKGAKEGIVVAGGNDRGSSLLQLADPQGIIVDQSGNVYVGDCSNNRIVRWQNGSKQGEIILGGYGCGQSANQFNGLRALSFDQHDYIYAVDSENHRIEKFIIDLN